MITITKAKTKDLSGIVKIASENFSLDRPQNLNYFLKYKNPKLKSMNSMFGNKKRAGKIYTAL